MVKAFIQAISKAFLISSLVPAAFFALLNQAVLLPVLSERLPALKTLEDRLLAIGGNWLFFACLTLMVAFSLASASPTIVKLFEGVFPFQRFFLGWRLKHHKARFERVYSCEAARQLEFLRRDYPDLRDEKIRRSFEAEIHRREDELLTEEDALDVVLWYPRRKEDVLPTRLGNILRASEDHGRALYHLDSILIWPRLLDLISVEHRAALEDARSSLEFLLNSSLLTWIFAIECGITLVLVGRWGAGILSWLILIGAGYGMYSTAIPVARVYGELVKSIIDRFRLSLLQSLSVPLPPNLEAERSLWERFNRFLVFGDAFDYPSQSR